jgi:hypothetical protein
MRRCGVSTRQSWSGDDDTASVQLAAQLLSLNEHTSHSLAIPQAQHPGRCSALQRNGRHRKLCRASGRGQRYHIVEFYNHWHLMDRWCERGNRWAARGESDRRYYRVECTPWLQADISYDQAQNVWVLDRILD